MNILHKPRCLKQKPRGQSFVEFGLILPVLLLLVLSVAEFGFMMNHYLAVVDATRNAARFASDGLYSHTSGDTNCTTTTDFYMQTACLVLQELAQEKPTITFDYTKGDDIVVTVVSVTGGASPVVSARYPTSEGTAGWSYAKRKYGVRKQSSSLTDADITAMLRANTPDTGLVVVELYHHYQQILGLPWLLPFLPNPVPFHTRTIMPLPSAEPVVPGP